MSVMEARDLSKSYGRREALREVSFAVEKGEVFGFLGPNGSGKTTAIAVFLGLLRPSSGSYSLFGNQQPDANVLATRVGATIDTPSFYPFLSGWTNLRIVADLKGAARADVERTLEFVGLWDRRKERVDHYSLGMKQRLGLAAGLLNNPELLILDEPTNGLDPAGIIEIRNIVASLRDGGTTVFLSSHLLSEVERMCSRVAVMRAGELLYTGSLEDLRLGPVIVEMRALDLPRAIAVAREYTGTIEAREKDGTILLQLKDAALDALSRHCAHRDVFVTHLCVRERSLEDIFLTLMSS